MKALLGCLLFISALPPFGVGLAGLLFLLPFLLDLKGKSIASSAIYGAFTGAFISAYIYWGTSSYSIYVYLFVIFLFIITFALFFAYSRFSLHRYKHKSILLIPALWLCIELVYAHFNIPFTYAIMLCGDPDLLQGASIGGQVFVSLLAISLQISLVLIFNETDKTSLKPAILAPTGIIALIFIGFYFTNQQDTNDQNHIQVALIQTNIPPVDTLDIASQDKLEKLHLLRTKLLSDIAHLPIKPDLLVWPEISLARYEFRNKVNIKSEAARLHLPMLVASPDMEPSGKVVNAVFSVSAKGNVVHRHVKSVLIPFLEDDISAGKSVYPHTGLPGAPGSLICFESAFSKPAVLLARMGAGLITISTNDAYAGPSFLPLIHNSLARLRAIETRKTVIRSANGGPSSIINSHGKIIKRSGLFNQDILFSRVSTNHSSSFYVKHYYSILYLYYLICGIFLIFSVMDLMKIKLLIRHLDTIHPTRSPVLIFICTGLLACLYQYKLISYSYLEKPGNIDLSAFQNEQYHRITAENLHYLYANTPRDSLYSSITYLLREYGNSSSPFPEYTKDTSSTPNRINLASIKRIADLYGYSFSLNILRRKYPYQIHTPSIALLDSGESVVIKEFQKDIVVFFSPSEEDVIAVSRKAFEQKWNGEYIYLLPHKKPWDKQDAAS